MYVVGESVSADGLRARENEEREKKVREKERGREERKESSERFVVSLFLSPFPFFSSPPPSFFKRADARIDADAPTRCYIRVS